MLVLSFALLYQDRIAAMLNIFALQAIALALSVAWQSWIQDTPHLLVTAGIAFIVKGVIIPTALHRIVRGSVSIGRSRRSSAPAPRC